MIEKSISLLLERENQTFQASISYLQGNLAALTKQLTYLHLKEKQVFQNYKYNRRKISYLLGRLSAKKSIQQLTNYNQLQNIWIDSGVFQFPIIKCPAIQNIQVSISHCDEIGISIAFPEAHPMGIDVEKIDIDRLDVVLSQMTNEEKKQLAKISKNHIGDYTCLFSAKEALSKVLKTGMMLDFKYLEVNEVLVKKQITEYTFSHFGQYKAYSRIVKNYAIAIVLPKRTTTNLTAVWKILDATL